MKNPRGFITIDFLFSFTLVMGFSALMFALSITLTVVEITQYITFATARAYFGGHTELISQNMVAQQKYAELINHPIFEPFYKNGWFEVSPEAFVGDMTTLIPQYSQSSPENPNQFIGAATPFIAHMLSFNIPFYGPTTLSENSGGPGFSTFIGSYLGREPTTNECLNFNMRRWRSIRTLQVMPGTAPYTTHTSDGGYVRIADNGC